MISSDFQNLSTESMDSPERPKYDPFSDDKLTSSNSAPKFTEFRTKFDLSPPPPIAHHNHSSRPPLFKPKPKRSGCDSDIDSSDVEKYTPNVIKRAGNYQEDEEKFEILGAHKENGQLKFAVKHKDNGKIYWHTQESMRVQHLGMLLHYYESHIIVGDIVA